MCTLPFISAMSNRDREVTLHSVHLYLCSARGKGFELVAAMTLVSPEARQVALKAMQPRMMILATQLQSEYTSTNVKVRLRSTTNVRISLIMCDSDHGYDGYQCRDQSIA